MCKLVVTFSQSNSPHGAGGSALVPTHMHKWGASAHVTLVAALASHSFANGTASTRVAVLVQVGTVYTLASHSRHPVANKVSPPTLVDIGRKYG